MMKHIGERSIIAQMLSEHLQDVNQLIDEYNNEETYSISRILILQRLDALARISLKDNPVRHYILSKISTELNSEYRLEPKNLLNTQKNLMDLSANKSKMNEQVRAGLKHDLANDIVVPMTKHWKKNTTPKMPSLSTFNFSADRSPQYIQMDNLIGTIENKTREGDKPAVIEALLALQEKILLIDIPKNKPIMRNRFDTLLEQTNAHLYELTKNDNVFNQSYLKEHQEKNIFIDILENDTDQFEPLCYKLFENNSQIEIINGNRISFLGGHNNYNWLVTDLESDSHKIIRVEEFDASTDLLVSELKRNTAVNSCFVRDDILLSKVLNDKDNYKIKNIALSEYCPDGDVMRYRQNKVNESDPDNVIIETLSMVEQIALISKKLITHNAFYPDIKPENFLHRSNGDVITADLKTLIDLNDGKCMAQFIATTDFYAPDEFLNRESRTTEINAEKFTVYQLGLTLYLLTANPKGDVNIMGTEKSNVFSSIKNREPLLFNFPVFDTPEGQRTKQLIESAISANPDDRPALNDFISQCNILKTGLEQKKDGSLANNISMIPT